MPEQRTLPPHAAQTQTHRGIVLIVGAMAFFSLSDALVKRLTAGGLPIVEIAWFRYVALSASIGWLVLRGGRLHRPRAPGLQLQRGLAVVGSALLFIAGLSQLPLAAATALVFSSPLFVTALSVLLLGEHVLPRQWGWVLLGFIGVLIVVRPGSSAFEAASLLPIASSAAWALGMVLTRRLAPLDTALTTQACTAAVGLALTTLLLPWHAVLPAPADLASLAGMALAWTLAQWMVVHAYSQDEAARLAPFAYSQLIWANLLSILLLAQLPRPITLLGTAVIVLAGLGAARERRSLR